MHPRPSAPDASQRGPHDTSIHRRRGDGDCDGRADGGGADWGHVPRGVPQGARPPLPARPPSPTAGQGHLTTCDLCPLYPSPGRAPLPGTLLYLPGTVKGHALPSTARPAGLGLWYGWGTAHTLPGALLIRPFWHTLRCTLPVPSLYPSCTLTVPSLYPPCTLHAPCLHPARTLHAP